ncbi:MAG: c-type cytochrome, partial [Gammaproteobacteria bacterium]|nr:c-type cytochrome [Gammaproteobacteria bacterium]
AIADYLGTLTTPPPTTVDGATLYADSCAACHGAGSSSTKIGATVTRINTGISSVASMNSLSNLSAAQIQAIADYLGTLTTPPPTTVDGATLYADSCAACHGAGSSSTKIGATVTRINTGISSVASMNSLSNLSAAQIQAIADYLGTLTTPPPTTVDGATLYANNCAACHGATTSSTKIGATALRINAGITSVTSMNYLSSLSAVEVQAIADYLGTLAVPPPTTDGASLYANNCASCHGAAAATTKGGANVARIDAGINSVASMNYLSAVLSATDIQAIANYLAQFAPSGGGTVPHSDFKDGVGHAIDKDTPFSSGCSSCHGASLQGAAGPSCTSCHDVKWNEEAPPAGGSTVPHSDINGGVGHAIDKDTPFSSGCTSCHGASLQGAIGPSCTSCHDVKWNEEVPPAGGSTVPHSDINGGVGHAIDKDTPFSSGCTSCHGTSLQGAIGPSCTSCHDVKWNENAPPSGGTLDGQAHYTSYCAACHGPSSNSTKTGADVNRINNAIASVSSMNSLASLSSAQIKAIADFLTASTPPPASGADGASLYANSCATCHGAGTSSTKAGASVVRIINSITGIDSISAMSALNNLRVSEVQLIADYLTAMGSSTPPPTTTAGESLYANSCASCHGAGSSSSKVGATVIRINTGIASVASMNALSSLTAAEVQAIADYLISLDTTAPPPTGGVDGATLYNNNCAACHGPGDSSAKAGATVSRINAGIASASGMNYLSTVLSTADIQAIADYLAATPSSGGGSVAHSDYKDGVGHAIDKDTPFSSGCSSCHGASLQGAIGPSCTSCHDVKWNEEAPPAGGGTVAHSDIKDGVGHAIDKDTPFSSGCTSCHGAELQGAVGPSCTSCHDVKWNEAAASSD